MSPDRPNSLFDFSTDEPGGHYSGNSDWLNSDGTRRKPPRSKGNWQRFTSTLPFPACESDISPRAPATEWLNDSSRYHRWQVENPTKRPLVVHAFVEGKQVRQDIFEFDESGKRYRLLSRFPRGYSAVALVVDSSVLTGEAEDIVTRQLRGLSGGGLLAVRVETKTKKQREDIRERLAGLANRVPLTRERITEDKSGDGTAVVVVGQKWKDRQGRVYDVKMTKAWRWLGPRLALMDSELTEQGVSIVQNTRPFETTYIPGLCQRLCTGEGLFLRFNCGCELDLRRPGVESLNDCDDSSSCSRVRILRRVFRSKKGISRRPQVFYANYSETKEITARMIRDFGGHDWNPATPINVNMLSGRKVVPLESLQQIGLDANDILPGEGLVFTLGRKTYYGCAISCRFYGVKGDSSKPGNLYGDPEVCILMLGNASTLDAFSAYL